MGGKKGSMFNVRSGSTIDERIEYNSIRAECGCRIWTGNVNNQGYPILWIKGRNRLVTRFVLERKVGPLPTSIFTRHTCDTPRCIAEDHLIPGPPKANTDDMIQRGRLKNGERHPMVKLSVADVITIRESAGTLGEIASQFGVTKGNIWAIKSRRTWSHVP